MLALSSRLPEKSEKQTRQANPSKHIEGDCHCQQNRHAAAHQSVVLKLIP